MKIGSEVRIHPGVIVNAQRGNIILGDNVSINDYSILYGSGDITIGNDVRIAAHVVIVSEDHAFDDTARTIRSQGMKRKSISIGNDVWIGAGARILAGSQICDGCVVGANAVVKGKTEPYGVYVGIPARLIKKRGN